MDVNTSLMFLHFLSNATEIIFVSVCCAIEILLLLNVDFPLVEFTVTQNSSILFFLSYDKLLVIAECLLVERTPVRPLAFSDS